MNIRVQITYTDESDTEFNAVSEIKNLNPEGGHLPEIVMQVKNCIKSLGYSESAVKEYFIGLLS